MVGESNSESRVGTLPPLFRIRQYDRQHRPPLFLIITSVASLGTCAGGGGGGTAFGDLKFFIEKSAEKKWELR
jgi:hypothetical protein